MTKRLEDFLISLSPELQQKIKTAQYAYAKELVSLRVAMCLSQAEMSEKIGIPHETLVDMEFASTNHPVGEYRDVLALVHQALDNMRKELSITEYEHSLITRVFPGGELPFYSHDLEELSKRDALQAVNNNELVGLVSDQAGGIIGYVQAEHAEYVASALNLHAVARSGRVE